MKIGLVIISATLLPLFVACGKIEPFEQRLPNKGEDTGSNSDVVVIDTSMTKESDVYIHNPEASTVNGDSDLRIRCKAGGGFAHDPGQKIWCWSNLDIPSGAPGDKDFGGGQLWVSAECSPNQITTVGNRLRFYLNPTTPEASSWCNNNYNMRAEIRTSPGRIQHPVGTEEWFGWSYTFGNGYKVDRENDWLFFQAHSGNSGETPMIALKLVKQNGGGSGNAGEIHIKNNTVGSSGAIYPTGVKPLAGQTVDIVMHIVWGDGDTGHLQVWLNGNKVHDKRERTVRASYPYGGNAKFGIYKSGWRNGASVQKSLDQGIDHLETFMGSLRMITRGTRDLGYGNNSYSEVEPIGD